MTMNHEAVQQTGASRYERTRSRVAYRNGVRRRSLRSRYGDLTLEKPVLREVPFTTRVFKRYSRIEKSLESVILESYLQGVSTRKIQEVISHFGVEKISPSYVSTLTKDLDEKVQAFLSLISWHGTIHVHQLVGSVKEEKTPEIGDFREIAPSNPYKSMKNLFFAGFFKYTKYLYEFQKRGSIRGLYSSGDRCNRGWRRKRQQVGKRRDRRKR